MCACLTDFFYLTVIILICSSEDANVILLAAENLGLHAGGLVFIVLQQELRRVEQLLSARCSGSLKTHHSPKCPPLKSGRGD